MHVGGQRWRMVLRLFLPAGSEAACGGAHRAISPFEMNERFPTIDLRPPNRRWPSCGQGVFLPR